MDRHEAVLRELNLYPLWVRREQSVQAMTEPSNPIRPDPVEPHAPLLTLRQAQGERTKESIGQAALVSEPAKLQPNDLNWTELKSTVHSCLACKLRAGCTQTVFGVGDEKADWLFVGEGPGADEDAQGEPFVGQAGKLLDNMLMAIKLKRGKNVYIANVVKCRPPEDESGKQLPPKHDEIAQCLPYLQRQITLIQPKVIVALGKIASNALLGKDATLASLRGAPHDYQGIPLIVTYHPAYLLRSPSEKAKAWQDLCLAQQTIRASS